MSDLILLEPSFEMLNQIVDFRQEFFDNGETDAINGGGGLRNAENFAQWIENENVYDEAKLTQGLVPATLWFSIRKSDGKIIGVIQLRHELNEILRNYGGHIGYSIRPKERGKGYGKEQLRLCLEKAKEIDIRRVMVSCEPNNKASSGTIIACNGKLEKQCFCEYIDGELSIYWIDL